METSKHRQSYVIPMIIIAGLFFIFGFVTWISGALIPFMKIINELTDSQSYLVATAAYISFVVMGLPSSFVLEKVGYKKGMSLGLTVMAIGALIFIPAASSRMYSLFLVGIFTQGAGITLLQTAANPYVTILGPIESGARRISIMGICNKIAGVLGASIFGVLLLSGVDELKEQIVGASSAEKEVLLQEMANGVVMPYLVMASILFLLAILVLKAPLPEISLENRSDQEEVKDTGKSIFQFPHLWLGILTLFVYVGVEVIAADTIISYGLALGIPAENPDNWFASASHFTSFTLMAMVGTYIIGALLIPKYLSQENALKISALLGIVFSVGILMTTGMTSVLFVAALGMANALVWPAVWPLTLNGLGKWTKKASALLIMAIAGGALLPLLYGYLVDMKKASLLAEHVSHETASAMAYTSSYWILIPCYAIIFFFAWKGHKIGVSK